MTRKEKSSFKDPGGHVFYEDGEVYRQINNRYKEDYNKLMESGLYQELVDNNLLIEHEETEKDGGFKVIKPEKIDFISYPYEWSFTQLVEAAKLTLKIQKIALKHGMTLKDASSYNIQFRNNKPVFIDTLSLEKYNEGLWNAYEQFCEQFLAPLALMHFTDLRMNEITKNYPDGVPIDLASKLLPFKTRLYPRTLLHINILSKVQNRNFDERKRPLKKISRPVLSRFIRHLETTVEKFDQSPLSETSEKLDTRIESKLFEYVSDSESERCALLSAKLEDLEIFERLEEVDTVFFVDSAKKADKIYSKTKIHDIDNVTTILGDFRRPSPGIGWANKERKKLSDRNVPKLGVSIRSIQRLAIKEGIPLKMISDEISELFDSFIVVFTPKNKSIFRKEHERKHIKYSKRIFEKEFKKDFEIKEKDKINDKQLYLLKSKKKK